MDLTRPTPPHSIAGSLAIARLQAWLQRLDRRRLFALALALAVGAITHGAVTRARQTVAALGTTEQVAITITEVSPGTELTDANVHIVSRPVGHVPSTALALDAFGRVAGATMMPGEIVVEPRVLAGSDAIGARERAVTIPMPLAPPPIEVGDVIELVGVHAADGPFGASASQLASGRIIAFDEEAITISTSPAQAMAVITHLGAGSVEVLLTPFDAVATTTS